MPTARPPKSGESDPIRETDGHSELLPPTQPYSPAETPELSSSTPGASTADPTPPSALTGPSTIDSSGVQGSGFGAQGETLASSGKPRTPDPEPQRLGKYELRGRLGEGGMGAVYRAYDPALKRLVALKTIKPDRSIGSAEKDRFIREAEAAAKLQHPHVIAIHDYGEEHGRPFFTMDLVVGGSLAERMNEYRLGDPVKDARGKTIGVTTRGWTRKRIEERKHKILELMEKVCRAVHAAHLRGIVHRDLKPSNILLENGEPRVSDFGLAKVVEADVELTPDEAFLGTPAYMSPEQHLGKTDQVGPASDIWALGVILYELCTGRRPYPGESKGEIAVAALKGDEPPRLCKLTPLVDRGMESVLLRCLRRQPAQRFLTALELAEELGRLRRGEPTVTRPEGLLIRSGRWLRRHAALVIVFFLLAILGSVLLAKATQPRPKDDNREKNARATNDDGERQAIQRDLSERRVARLQDEAGMLRVMKIKDLAGRSRIAASGGELRVEQDEGFTLVQTLTDPFCKSYEFSAEVRQDAGGPGGSVGLVILDWERTTPGAEEHAMLLLGFADLRTDADGVPALARLNASLYRRMGQGSITHPLLRPPDGHRDARPGAFRKLRVCVSPNKIDLWFDDTLLTSRGRAELLALARENLYYGYDPGRTLPKSEHQENMIKSNQGARELYFREVPSLFALHSRATFQNLAITPVGD
jgi:serine/threonine protein kinase